MILAAVFVLAASASPIERDIAQVVAVGGVHVEDDKGAVLVSWHSDDLRIPASVLKLATAAAALHELGPETRIATDFAYDPTSCRLCVIGGGDPFLVSESLGRAADSLVARGVAEVAHMTADAGLFVQPLRVDGRGASSNPYDAGISAFSANFNTVVVSIDDAGGVGPGEWETPLTPMAREMGRRVGRPGVHRLPIRDGVTAAPLYGLELLRELLRERGVTVVDSMALAPCRGESALVYRHHSLQTVAGTAAAMMEYSNNVIANMLLLSAASRHFGRPVGMADGTALLRGFLADELGLSGFEVLEGSGLSRGNRMTPRQVVAVLRYLRSHGAGSLLPLHDGVRAKTGTLSGITCLGGYLDLPDGRVASFAILLEGPLGLRDKVFGTVRRGLASAG